MTFLFLLTASRSEVRAQPSRQSNLTLRYGRKICHRNFPMQDLFKKVHDSMKENHP